jgi:hypothetical protein
MNALCRAAHGDVYAAMAVAIPPAFLKNHLSPRSYLIGWTMIVLAGEGMA